MSYRILIVDDEPIILSGIKYLLHWEEFDAEVVATARNGVEAFGKIESLHPDIVITDIKMPLMDGLQLLEQANERFPEIVFILLTSLEEFKLAKRAIKHNAVDYLLKNELDESVLAATLKRAMAESDSRNELMNIKGSAVLDEDGIGKTAASIFQTEEIPQERISLLHRHGLLNRYAFVGVYVSCPDPSREESKEERELRVTEQFNWVREISEKILRSYIPKIHRIDPVAERFHLICYLASDIDPLGWPRMKRTLQEKIAKATMTITGAKTEFLATGIAESPNRIGDSKREFDALLDAHYLEKENPSPVSLDLERAFWRIEFAVQNGDRDNFSMTLDNLISAIGTKDHRKNQALFVTDGIISALKAGFADSPLALDCDELIRSAVTDFSFAETRREIVAALENLRREVLALYSPGSGNQNPAVLKAKKYVYDHITSPITLADAAESACVSPSYLSALFKRSTGKSLVEYVNEMKVEKAKELFDQGRNRVDETALSLGFENIYYFSKVFKKVTGQSPTGYIRRIRNIK